jgi:hypothetical protein
VQAGGRGANAVARPWIYRDAASGWRPDRPAQARAAFPAAGKKAEIAAAIAADRA